MRKTNCSYVTLVGGLGLGLLATTTAWHTHPCAAPCVLLHCTAPMLIPHCTAPAACPPRPAGPPRSPPAAPGCRSGSPPCSRAGGRRVAVAGASTTRHRRTRHRAVRPLLADTLAATKSTQRATGKRCKPHAMYLVGPQRCPDPPPLPLLHPHLNAKRSPGSASSSILTVLVSRLTVVAGVCVATPRSLFSSESWWRQWRRRR